MDLLFTQITNLASQATPFSKEGKEVRIKQTNFLRNPHPQSPTEKLTGDSPRKGGGYLCSCDYILGFRYQVSGFRKVRIMRTFLFCVVFSL